MTSIYGAIPPLIPGDKIMSNFLSDGSAQINGTLTISSATIYPNTYVTPGKLIVEEIESVSFVTDEITSDTISFITSSGNYLSVFNQLITATSSTMGFYGAVPIIQPTTITAVTSAFIAGAGTNINTLSTFDGYTVSQVVGSLRSVGILK